MTEQPTLAERTDALLLARDPFLAPVEAPRLRQLRAVQSDDAVTAADLQFVIGLYRRLANNLDTLKDDAVRDALLRVEQLQRRQRRTGGLWVRLEASPWFVWPVAVIVLAWAVVAVVIVARAS